jgi:hypothetical protein
MKAKNPPNKKKGGRKESKTRTAIDRESYRVGSEPPPPAEELRAEKPV